MHDDTDDESRAEWVQVASFATGLEADIAKNTLEDDGIPVLVQSNAPGIFGLAYQGGVAGGVRLHVPTPEVSRARELLAAMQPRHLDLVTDDDVFPDGDEAPEQGSRRRNFPDAS